MRTARALTTVLAVLTLCAGTAWANDIPSSTMYFHGTLTDNGNGTYTGVVAMIDEGDLDRGYDIYAENGATAWFGNDPGDGAVWTSQVIGTDHDAWPTFPTDTPDWYQYSLNLYEDTGQQKWAVRNHPGATQEHPWYDEGEWGTGGKPPCGVPMSGLMNWTTLFAAETDTGAYLPSTGTANIPGGAAGYGGGAGAWDMDWSWGSEAVPLELGGFTVSVTEVGGGVYDVTLTPGTLNTIESSTMIFEGALVNAGGGVYTGTIPMTVGAYYVPGGEGECTSASGGFDVYAQEGGTAYVAGSTWPIGSDHDAYSESGPWGTWWDPDCADYYAYELELTADHWYLRYAATSESPMSGEMRWTSMYAAETDPGTQDGGHDGSAAHGGGAGAWDWDCGWGVEVIPLELPGFDVDITDLGGGNFRATLTPAGPSDVWVDDDFDDTTPGWGVTHFDKIQDGIDAVAGSTVNVAPGAYEEQLHITTDNLHLIGSGSGSNPAVDSIIQSPAALTWFYTTSANNYPIVGIDGATGVSIENLRIDGLERGNANYRFQGIGFWNAGGVVTDCVIVNVIDSPFSGAQHGVGIYAYNNTGGPYTINLTNVDVIDYQKGGIALNGDGVTANLTGCTTVGQGATATTAQNGIQLWGPSGTISDCSVTGNIYTGGSWAASGILLISSGAVNITDTIVIDGDPAVYCQDTNATVDGLAVSNIDPNSGNGFYVRDEAGMALGGGGDELLTLEKPAQAFGDFDGMDGGGAARATLSVSIDNSTFTGHCTSGYGVSASNYTVADTIALSVTNSTITDWQYGFVVFGSGGNVAVTASNNAIFGNEAGFYSALPGQVAINNWWGDASGPLDDGGTIPANNSACAAVADIINSSGLGDYVFDEVVEYCPWLDSYPRLTLEPDFDCYALGETVTVELWMHDITDDIVGGQFFLEYDDSILEFTSADAESPFWQLYEITSTSGLIDYAVQITAPGTTTGSVHMATLEFEALIQLCSECTLITWRPHAPPTRLSDDQGGAVYPALVNMDIIDDEAPTFTLCPSDLTVECDGAGNTAARDAWLASAAADDNCGTVVITNDFTALSDDCGATGSAFVTWTAEDDCGNTSTCTATFTIEDTTVPSITTGASNQTVECDGAGNGADLTAWLNNNGGAAASDDCGGVTWSYTPDPATLSDLCGATGAVTVTFRATDDCGLFSETTATFTVEDTTIPSITTVASDQTVECDGAGNTTEFANWLANNGGAVASDDCGGVTWSNNSTGLSDLCGATGAETVTFTATDDCGLFSQTTATFTIEDTTPPVISGCPGNIPVNADAGSCDAVVTWTPPTADDACGMGTFISTHMPGDTFSGGVTTVTYTATDDCGNISYCSFDVTVSAYNELVVDVDLSPTMVVGPITRCITFELWNCADGDTAPRDTVSQVIQFTNGSATNVSVLVDCDEYDCITARDTLHTLRTTDLDDFGIVGTQYVADFTDLSGSGGDDDSLIGGNLNDDVWIDILDFGVFSWQWNVWYPNSTSPTGDTDCSTAYPHADINGDGLAHTADFTFISNNFLFGSEADCCPTLLSLGGNRGPITEISVGRLRAMGLGELSAGDLNGDGWLDEADIAAFMQGARPKPGLTPVEEVMRSSMEPAAPAEAELRP